MWGLGSGGWGRVESSKNVVLCAKLLQSCSALCEPHQSHVTVVGRDANLNRREGGRLKKKEISVMKGKD